MGFFLSWIQILPLLLSTHTYKIILGQYVFEMSEIFLSWIRIRQMWTLINSPQTHIPITSFFSFSSTCLHFIVNTNHLNYHIYKCTNKQWCFPWLYTSCSSGQGHN